MNKYGLKANTQHKMIVLGLSTTSVFNYIGMLSWSQECKQSTKTMVRSLHNVSSLYFRWVLWNISRLDLTSGPSYIILYYASRFVHFLSWSLLMITSCVCNHVLAMHYVLCEGWGSSNWLVPIYLCHVLHVWNIPMFGTTYIYFLTHYRNLSLDVYARMLFNSWEFLFSVVGCEESDFVWKSWYIFLVFHTFINALVGIHECIPI